MVKSNLIIDSLICIGKDGMPEAPKLRQLIDTDVRTLFRRDKTPNKQKYIAECIVIYYLGDPKSPARQSGLSDPEALKMAIEQAGLEKDYMPDDLVLNLIKRYYEENITEAGKVIENILKGIHNINLSIDIINDLLNEKLNTGITIDDVPSILTLIDNVNKKSGEIPSILKRLEEAKQNLIYETENEISRGGGVVLSSMNAEDYEL